MALIRWQPFDELERLFDQGSNPAFQFGWDLAVDVSEDDGNVVVEMNAPGVDPEKLDVNVENHHLRVSGSREETREQEDKQYYSKEIKRGSFERTVRLPTDVKASEANATYENGKLTVTIPKQTSEAAGKIDVEVK